MPTRERLAKAVGAFEIGGSGVHRVVRMLDAPLEQMRAREQLTETQYHTLRTFRMHWFLGHHAGNLHAVDLNRIVFGQEGFGEIAEQIWHSQMYYLAYHKLSTVERDLAVRVVLEECNITEAGAWLGYHSPYRGRQAVLVYLRHTAEEILSAWLHPEQI